MVLAMGEALQAVTTAPMMSSWLVFNFGSSRADRSSGRGRNIEPPGREGLERGVEHAGGDHRREESGVRRGEGDAAVAICGECAGKTLRLVIDRQPVGRHDPQCKPEP